MTRTKHVYSDDLAYSCSSHSSITLLTWRDRPITIWRDLLNVIARIAARLIGQTITSQPLKAHPRAYLVVLNRGEGTRPKEDTVPISRDEVRIGRDPNNADLLLDDPSISRRHAILRWDHEAEAYFLMEDGGRSGTFVAGKRVQTGQSVRLASGDSIALGPVQFRFYDADDVPS